MRPRLHEDPLPGFVRPGEVLRAAIPALRPPRRVTVAESAERWRWLRNPGGGYSGPWRNDFAPYLTAPMEDLTDREVAEIVILGPAQFGKTEIILNLAVHEAAEGGADLLIFQPTQALAVDFAERRMEKTFGATPELQALLGGDRGDDKLLTKLFRNGSRITIGWPVSAQLASRPVPKVVLDERDSMDDDIAGEGDPVELARQRTTTFGRHAKVLVSSTPKRQDGSGTLARWRLGDQRLWHVPCPHCGAYCTPGFDRDRRPTRDHLVIKPGANEEEARRDVVLACPANGCLIEERHKGRMNARGVWLPVGATIAPDGTIGGTPLRSRVRSYWFSGLMQRTRNWGDIAAGYVAAMRAVEERQDEEPLRTWWNTVLGAPYRSILASAAALEPEELQRRAEDVPLGRVPAWAGFVTAAVDVQGTRFDVLALAWGPDGRSQVVEHFQIFRTVDPDGSERLVEPPRRAEDWDLLTRQVMERAWPGEGGTEYRAVTVAVDTGGSDGVTGHAYEWWHRLRRDDAETARRVMLIKGESRRDVPLISLRRIETDRDGKRLKRGIALALLNTQALKDQVDLKLRMTRPGPGWIHLPKGLSPRFFEEATAETRGPKGWEKVRTRNEAFDLLVYNLACWYRRGGPRLDWNRLPDWARPRAASTPLEQLAANIAAVAKAASAAATPTLRVVQPVAPTKPAPKPVVPGRSRFWKPAAGLRRLTARL
jgi:phage terminase large subunit GpA-like protein